MPENTFVCLECGYKVMEDEVDELIQEGCPSCGGTDVDLESEGD